MTVARTVNKFLKAIFDTTHNVFKSLVSNPDGTPEVTINKPTDYNIGAIAELLEWNRQLTLCLTDQIRLDLAQDKFLDLIAHTHIGIVRYDSETDAEYAERIQNFVIAPKNSPASIIYYTTPFSSPGAPVLLEGQQDAAFADVSFSDVYSSFQNQQAGDEYLYWIFPAIASTAGGSSYFFTLILQNTAAGDIAKVVDLVNRWIAAGIDYEIHVETV